MGLDTLLENQHGHLPKFHIYSLSTSGVKIELIFSLGAAVSEIWADFQKLHIYPFFPRWGEIEPIFALQAAVSEIWDNFQNCHIWV